MKAFVFEAFDYVNIVMTSLFVRRICFHAKVWHEYGDPVLVFFYRSHREGPVLRGKFK